MMSPEEAVDELAAGRGDAFTVLTMTAYGLWPSDGPTDMRLLGLMGGASGIGLGVAIARPDLDVWIVDGDGSLLMQLGVLSAVGDAKPPRLKHFVIWNGVYGVSGAQPLPAASKLDFPAMADAAGYEGSVICGSVDQLREEIANRLPGPRLVLIECEARRPEFPPGRFQADMTEEAIRVRLQLEPDHS